MANKSSRNLFGSFRKILEYPQLFHIEATLDT